MIKIPIFKQHFSIYVTKNATNIWHWCLATDKYYASEHCAHKHISEKMDGYLSTCALKDSKFLTAALVLCICFHASVDLGVKTTTTPLFYTHLKNLQIFCFVLRKDDCLCLYLYYIQWSRIKQKHPTSSGVVFRGKCNIEYNESREKEGIKNQMRSETIENSFK